MPYVYDNVSGQTYDEMIRRLNREHNAVFHARTGERIVGCTSDSKPTVEHTKHLGGFPTVAYHRSTNRVQVSGKFVVQPHAFPDRTSPRFTEQLNYRLVGDLIHKNTSQYKTAWNTRGQCRSKV